MNENFTFLTLKMDSLAEKNDCTRCLFFSSGGTRLVSDPLIERRDKIWLIERMHLMLSL